jgi:hypothetical protein
MLRAQQPPGPRRDPAGVWVEKGALKNEKGAPEGTPSQTTAQQ